MLATRSADIVETATGVKIPPSGDMSFPSTTSFAMSSVKRFKATYSCTIGLAREVVEIGAGWRWWLDLVISLHTIQSFGTGETIHVWFCALHQSGDQFAEVMAAATITQ